MSYESNLGNYSPLPKEIEGVRKQAIDAGRNPDEAEATFRKKMADANARAQIDREENQPRIDLGSIDGGAGLK